MGCNSTVTVGKKESGIIHVSSKSLSENFNSRLLNIEDLNNTLLNFRVNINNIRFENCRHKNVEVDINFGLTSHNFTTEFSNTDEVKFNFTASFTYSNLYKNLSSDYIEFALKKKGKRDNLKTIGILRIDCFTLAVGPIEHDFALFNIKNPKKFEGRLHFKIEFSHIRTVKIKLSNLSIHLFGNSTNPVSISVAIHGNDHSLEANKSQMKRPEYNLDNDESIAQFVEQDDLPVISFDTTYLELGSSCINLIIWVSRECKKTQISKRESSKSIKSISGTSDMSLDSEQFLGQMYISFTKLLKTELVIFDIKDSQLLHKSFNYIDSHNFENFSSKKLRENFSKKFTEKLWKHGKEIGKVVGVFDIFSVPLLKQMIIGVHTEEGFKVVYSNLLEANSSLAHIKSSSIVEIEELNHCRLIMEKYSINNESIHYKVILETLKKVLNIINSSHNSKQITFMYKKESDLINAQEALIEMGFHCLLCADYIDYDLRGLYYDILIQIIFRGEMNLGSMSIKSSSNDSLYLQKANVSILYQSFLYKNLKNCLDKLNMKGIDYLQRNYIEKFLSVAFFRIPEFRDVILKLLDNDQKYAIPEWQQSFWCIENHKIETKTLSSFFDWSTYFYENISLTGNFKEKSKNENMNLLKKLLGYNDWKHRMEKRGLVYFYFVKNYVKYIFKHSPFQEIPWEDIPGYNIILKSFLIELKERNIVEYPYALIKTSKTLLYCPKLLSIFSTIVLQQVKIENFKSVCSALDLITKWILKIYKMNQNKFPTNFDFSFFSKSICKFIEEYENPSCGRVLFFLFSILHMIPLKDSIYLITRKLLRDKIIYKLMFHWSSVVRKLFHYIIIYHGMQRIEIHNITSPDESRKKSDFPSSIKNSFNINSSFFNLYEILKFKISEYSKIMNLLFNNKEEIFLQNKAGKPLKAKRYAQIIKDRCINSTNTDSEDIIKILSCIDIDNYYNIQCSLNEWVKIHSEYLSNLKEKKYTFYLPSISIPKFNADEFQGTQGNSQEDY